MNNEKSNTKFKTIGVICGVLALIIVVAGSTYALFTWNASDTAGSTVIKTENTTITYDDGEDISGKKLIPTTEGNSTDGIVKTITIKKQSNMTLTWNLTLNITALDTGLAHASFKWAIYESGNSTALGSGNFAGKSAGSAITLFNTNQTVESTTKTYELHIWIDSGSDNPSTMYNKNFSGYLRADVTQSHS